MTRVEMKEMLNSMDLIERDLMRSLTPEEEEIIINNGWQALFDELGFEDNDYKTFRRIEALISAFCTESEERYEQELNCFNGSAKFVLQSIVNDLEAKEAEELAKRREEIKVGACSNKVRVCSKSESAKGSDFDLDKLEPEPEEFLDKELFVEDVYKVINKFCNKDKECDQTVDYIKRLRNGEVLTLTPEEIDDIVEVIWNEGEDCNIQIVNNTIRLKK